MREITRRRLLVRAGGAVLGFTVAGCAGAAGSKTHGKLRIPLEVIGGVSLFGGRGSAIGAICGAFVLTLLVNVLFYANIDPLFQPFYQGLFLVLAVGASTLLGRALRRRA